MISTVTQEFIGQLVPEPTIHTLDDFDLEVKGAGGQLLPYLGYVIVDVRVPFLEDKSLQMPLLVVPLTEYNKTVPVIVGTNIIRHFTPVSSEESEVPQSWTLAFNSICSSNVGSVKSTTKVVLQPLEAKTVTGFVRKTKQVDSAVTEIAEAG